MLMLYISRLSKDAVSVSLREMLHKRSVAKPGIYNQQQQQYIVVKMCESSGC